MQLVYTHVMSFDIAETWFCPSDDDGCNVQASADAIDLASEKLDAYADEIKWHTPDVFSVRYGSCYVATASVGDRAVRFVTAKGDFREGDDK